MKFRLQDRVRGYFHRWRTVSGALSAGCAETPARSPQMKHAIFTGFPLRNAYAVNCDDGALMRAPAQ
jgi:hypothetical protein